MNVILLYTGNVGSTPTVEFLKTVDGIFDPTVHEDFDEWKFIEYAGDKDSLFPRLIEILEAVYAGRQHPFFDAMARDGGCGVQPAPRKRRSVVFKWRPYAINVPAADDFRALMETYDVRPVIIRRRSVVDQALKIYLTETVYGNRWPQFEAGKMTSSQYAAYLADQEAVRIRIDTEGLRAVRKIAMGFLARSRALIQRRDKLFPKKHKGDYVVTTEALYAPLVERNFFDNYFSSVFEHPIRIDTDTEIRTRKGGLNIEHCVNHEAVAADKKLQALEHDYQKLQWFRNP